MDGNNDSEAGAQVKESSAERLLLKSLKYLKQ